MPELKPGDTVRLTRMEGGLNPQFNKLLGESVIGCGVVVRYAGDLFESTFASMYDVEWYGKVDKMPGFILNLYCSAEELF